jgi:hypothetical protein
MKREDNQIWDFFCHLKKAYSGGQPRWKQKIDGAGGNCPDCRGTDREPHIQPMVAAATCSRAAMAACVMVGSIDLSTVMAKATNEGLVTLACCC